MKFDDKFPNALPDDGKEYDRCMIKVSQPAPCFKCGSNTHWVDIDYQTNVCSVECQTAIAVDAAKCDPCCPDCGTTLEKRFHFIGDHELPYWVCPKCHDADITLEFRDLDTNGKYRWVYKDGFYELKEQP